MRVYIPVCQPMYPSLCRTRSELKKLLVCNYVLNIAEGCRLYFRIHFIPVRCHDLDILDEIKTTLSVDAQILWTIQIEITNDERCGTSQVLCGLLIFGDPRFVTRWIFLMAATFRVDSGFFTVKVCTFPHIAVYPENSADKVTFFTCFVRHEWDKNK
jgi:hypothetical protein